MASINVNMSDELRKFVDEQVVAEGFSTPTEYVRQLIRDARKRSAQDKLEVMLLEGINSGPKVALDEAEWERMRREAHRQVEARKSGGR